MPDFIDLLNEIAGKESENPKAKKHGKFRASIMTAFTAYLPFYENVVLRRLMASGCRYNVLLVDAHDLAQSLQDPDRMPRLAGRNYVLAPMLAPGAFHPKIVMLLGEHNARVLVGSHNATLSGFGHNRELTTRIDLGRKFTGEYRAFFQAVWHFFEAWLSTQQGRLPQNVYDSVMRVRTKYAPWLHEQEEQTAEVRFFGAMPDGESLWQRVHPFLPESVTQAIVLGPFFDKEGEFLKRLHEELVPQSITVGLEPEAKNISLCRLDGLPPELRFHNASSLAERGGYLHAKALYVAGVSGEAVLVTGSANPSHPAWGAEPSRRNAEAVVLHLGEDARHYAEALGLLGLSSMPEISDSRLQQILKATPNPEPPPSSNALQVLVAEITEEGIQLTFPSCVREEVEACRIQFGDHSFTDNAPVMKQENGLLIRLPERSDAVTHIMLRLSNGRRITAFVHDHRAVTRLATTSKQQSFRDALDSLGGDSPDFDTLLRLADKLIFEESETQETAKKMTSAKAGKSKEEKGEDVLGPLSVSTNETKRQQRRTRELYHGDLAYIIDTLIYHLGIGLHEAAEKLESHTPSEEEMVGKEEDETEVLPPEVKPFNLVKICHSKVATLVKRMCKQFEKAKPDTPEAYKAVEQILAVLAVLREVRVSDLRLARLTEGNSLVPMAQRRKLLQATLKALFGGDKGLFERTAERFKDDPDNDLALLLGLIIWMAWDCELELRKADNVPVYDFEARREILLELAYLFEIALRAGKRENAFEEARYSALRTCPNRKKLNLSRWMRLLENWTNDLQNIDFLSEKGLSSDMPKLGQIGLATKIAEPKPRIVLGTHNNVVLLAEISKAEKVVKFTQDSVLFVGMPEFRNSPDC